MLTVILWTILLIGCFNTINTSLDNNAIDVIFSMIFDKTVIDGHQTEIIKALASAFLIGTILQSFTYYTVNINYQKLTGTVRFSFKKMINAIFRKLFKKELKSKKANGYSLSEVEIGPKKLTFLRAIITSIISIIITVLVCISLFVIGTLLSDKVISIL